MMPKMVEYLAAIRVRKRATKTVIDYPRFPPQISGKSWPTKVSTVCPFFVS